MQQRNLNSISVWSLLRWLKIRVLLFMMLGLEASAVKHMNLPLVSIIILLPQCALCRNGLHSFPHVCLPRAWTISRLLTLTETAGQATRGGEWAQLFNLLQLSWKIPNVHFMFVRSLKILIPYSRFSRSEQADVKDFRHAPVPILSIFDILRFPQIVCV